MVKSWRLLALGVVLLGVATATVVLPFASHGARSVRMLIDNPRSVSTRFDRRQSAALFIGVQRFASDSVEEVPFAADDAVDLAHVFAFERHVHLVPPRRVMLVLSGQPKKKESRERLRALRDAGADVRYHADAASILASLREQAAVAGRDGMLIVSIATHGFLRDGNGYVLGATSVVHDPATMLSTAEVFETIAASAAQRSLVFVDACRERMVKGRRAVMANPASTAPPLERRLGRTHGQAVFYAAAAGESAYDDFAAHNGVFTKAVIEGVRCGAAKSEGMVTADTLASFVQRKVRAWIRDNRDPSAGSATQSSMDGDARNMPLAQCWGPLAAPLRIAAEGMTIRALSEKNELLWRHDAGDAVRHFKALDLDADGRNEVVFSAGDAVTVLDDNGNQLWSASDPMKLTDLVTGDLFHQHTNEVVVLRNDQHSPASRLVVYGPDGACLGALDSSHRLDHLAIWHPTNRHAAKIVATSGNILLVFNPKKLAAGKPLWAGRIASRAAASIRSIEIVDCDGDGKSDLALTTAGDAKVFVDLKGRAIGKYSSAHFQRVRAWR